MLKTLVDGVLKKNQEYLGLEDVIEKEILHHDIMEVLHHEGVLGKLTFIGGTSLRLCYNSSRLSEDLDFTGGIDFKANDFSGLGEKLQQHLENKYALNVSVREPKLTKTDTSTWKITIEKHSDRPDLPSQKMHIDVCSLPSFDIQTRGLMDHYNIGSAMMGLPIPVQSRKEILADKMIALAFRERRIKPRDVWDIGWLNQQGIEQSSKLVLKKLEARGKRIEDFFEQLKLNGSKIKNDSETKRDFQHEMKRFLPQNVAERTIGNPKFWEQLSVIVNEEVEQLMKDIENPRKSLQADLRM